jgi:hypothetical protein
MLNFLPDRASPGVFEAYRQSGRHYKKFKFGSATSGFASASAMLADIAAAHRGWRDFRIAQ